MNQNTRIKIFQVTQGQILDSWVFFTHCLQFFQKIDFKLYFLVFLHISKSYSIVPWFNINGKEWDNQTIQYKTNTFQFIHIKLISMAFLSSNFFTGSAETSNSFYSTLVWNFAEVPIIPHPRPMTAAHWNILSACCRGLSSAWWCPTPCLSPAPAWWGWPAPAWCCWSSLPVQFS